MAPSSLLHSIRVYVCKDEELAEWHNKYHRAERGKRPITELWVTAEQMEALSRELKDEEGRTS